MSSSPDSKYIKQLSELNLKLQLKVQTLEAENENLLTKFEESETEKIDFAALRNDLAEMRQHLLRANNALIQKREEIFLLREQLENMTRESGKKIRFLEISNKHLSRLASQYPSSSTESIWTGEEDIEECSLNSGSIGKTHLGGGSASSIPKLISSSGTTRLTRAERAPPKYTPLAPHNKILTRLRQTSRKSISVENLNTSAKRTLYQKDNNILFRPTSKLVTTGARISNPDAKENIRGGIPRVNSNASDTKVRRVFKPPSYLSPRTNITTMKRSNSALTSSSKMSLADRKPFRI